MNVEFYQDRFGKRPAHEWLQKLPFKARKKGNALIGELALKGHRLGRPHCAFLRDKVYELRWRVGNIQYRLMYFYADKTLIIVASGFIKEKSQVPESEIELALKRMKDFNNR